MKVNLLFISILFFVATGCEKEEKSIDPIIGKWMLVNKSIDGSNVELTECLLKNNVIFSTDESVTFNSYNINEDSGDCEFQSWVETWSGGNNGRYGVYSGSLFIQERWFKIENSQLIYYVEGWEITENEVITHDLFITYEKE